MMLTINGKKYAKNNKAFVGSLFDSGGTCAGFFKTLKGGIILMDMQGEVFAAIVHHTNFTGIVSATRTSDGRCFYAQSASAAVAANLGVPTKYSDQQAYALELFNAATKGN